MGKSLAHEWVVAAMVRVDPKTAKIADFRQSFRVAEGQRIEALEVYCEKCRRPFDEAADTTCQAKVNNEHLIGGDQSERAKRKHTPLPAGAVVVPGPRINRRGIGAVLSGEA